MHRIYNCILGFKYTHSHTRRETERPPKDSKRLNLILSWPPSLVKAELTSHCKELNHWKGFKPQKKCCCLSDLNRKHHGRTKNSSDQFLSFLRKAERLWDPTETKQRVCPILVMPQQPSACVFSFTISQLVTVIRQSKLMHPFSIDKIPSGVRSRKSKHWLKLKYWALTTIWLLVSRFYTSGSFQQMCFP